MNRRVFSTFLGRLRRGLEVILLVVFGGIAWQASAQVTVTPAFAFGGPVANTTNTTVSLTFNVTVGMTTATNISSSAPITLTNATFVSPVPISNDCPTSAVGVSATQVSLSPAATPVLSDTNTFCTIRWTVTINGPVSGNANIGVAANSLSAFVTPFLGPGVTVAFPPAAASGSTSIGSAPPTMTVAVAPSTIRPDENVIATYTLTSSQINGDFISSGQIFMPAGVTINTSPPPSNTCGTFGFIGSIPDFFSFGMGTVPNTGCTITLSLKASAAGVYTLTVNPGDLNAGSGNVNTSTANFSAQSPIITPQTPNPSTVFINSQFAMGYQLVNPGGASSQVGGTITFPTGFTYSFPPTTSCSGLTFTGSGNQIGFTGSMTAGEICNVNAQVRANSTPGPYLLTVTPGSFTIVDSNNTNNSTAPLTVIAATPSTVAVAVSPSTVLVNGNSTLTYTFSNPNAQPLPISFGTFDIPFGVNVVGVPANTCGGTTQVILASITQIRIDNGAIPANGTCTFTATVNSANAGVYNFGVSPGNLTAVVGNSNSATAALTVAAAAPNFTLTEGGVNIGSGLTFAPQPVGTNSTSRTILLTNTGNASLVISSIAGVAPFNDFSFTTTCPIGTPPVIPAGTCNIVVTFSPAAAGARNATIAISSNSIGGSPVNIALAGTGTQPGVSLAPIGPLTFAAQNVGSTSPVQTMTLTNTGNAGLLISAIATTGDFAATSNCPIAPSALPAGNPPINQCTISVTFAPTSITPPARTGTLTITTTNAPPNTYSIALNGTATAAPVPVLSVVPATLTFAPTPLGSASATQQITVSNPSNANLIINSITGVAPFTDFAFTTTCPVGTPPLFPNQTCNILVTFAPTAAGARTGTIAINSNAPAGVPFNISLAGTGAQADVLLNPAPPTPLNFPAQIIGTTSAAQTVTISNTGTAPLLIASISTIGDFAATSNCPIAPATLANGTPPLNQCTINVTFTPTSLQPAARVGTLLLATANAPTNSYSIGLNGTAAAVPVAAVSVTPTSLAFPATTVGSASAAQRLTVTNTGTANLTGITIATSAGYQRVAVPPSANGPFDCGATLAPSTSCVIEVQFVPTAAGSFPGQVTITSPSVTPNTTTIPVSGVGTPAPVPVIALPSIVNFGDQIIGTTSAGQTVAIGNTGTATMTVSGITVTGADAASFTTTSGCGAITPGTSCNVTVSFSPATLGTKNAALSVVSNAQNAATANAVALTGVGVPVPRPIATLSLTAISFGNTIFGGAAATQTVVLQNTGVLPLAISGVVASPDYVQLNNCPASLAPQASCTLQVQFVPTGLGPRVGDLQVISNAQTSPDRVALRGVGCRWFSVANARLFTTLCGN